MASLSFSPIGSQLDNDSIPDLQLNTGEDFSVSFELDTSGLDNNLLFLELQGDIDFTELSPIMTVRTDEGISLLPDFSIVEESTGDNFSSQIFTLSGLPGATPDTIEIIIEGGEAQTVTLKLSEPAPPGGLVVDTLITDSDTEADTIPVFEQAQNLVDAEVVVENGQAIARFIIEEGATDLDKLLNQGELKIKWKRNIKNKGNAVIAS
ncbi:MAG: hypothetical protein QNJ34_13100 [Xenococcaceae cyanobacterium MO_188.B29]|nr:hypothetical protein [Xenococcaceae cyanobacterium MO_188.B29]